MDRIVITLLIVLSLAGIIYGLCKWYARSMQRAAEEYALDWVKRVEQAETDEETVAVGALRLNRYENHRHLSDTAREHAAMLKYQDATARIKTTKLAAEARVANAADLARLCISFYEDYRSLDADAIFKVPSNELGRLFTDAMAQTLVDARSGDVLALYSYKRVMSNSYMRRFCDQYDVPYPTYPSDWDDIVVRYIETPSVSDFKNIPEQTVGQVQMLAARATRTNDTKLAKLVLAYCLTEYDKYGQAIEEEWSQGYSRYIHEQSTWPFRDAIGSVMLDRLIRLVESANHTTSSYREALEA